MFLPVVRVRDEPVVCPSATHSSGAELWELVGIADSWGFQVIAEVFWNWSLALSAVLLGLQDLLSVHDCAAVLCLIGFLLSQELHGSERNCVPPHHSQRGSPASCT